MNKDIAQASEGKSLFSKTMMVLTGMMGLGAAGAYAGTGLTGGIGLLLGIGWIVLTIVAVIALYGATKNRGALPVATAITGVWTFVSGLVMGPAISLYVADLGANTVIACFLGTSAVMAVCGAIGMLSGRNFSGLGGILSIGLWGLIIVGLIGAFFHFSQAINVLYCVAGLVIFTGYFLYDFWRLKEAGKSGENDWATAMLMAMSIYLDFLNFFLYLLRLVASGKDSK